MDCRIDNPVESFLPEIRNFPLNSEKNLRVFVFSQEVFFLSQYVPVEICRRMDLKQKNVSYTYGIKNLEFFKINNGVKFAVEFLKVFFHLHKGFAKIQKHFDFRKFRSLMKFFFQNVRFAFFVLNGVFNKVWERKICQW